MNNKNVELADVVSIPYMPELSAVNRSRIFTKHFTNCALYMGRNELSMLLWLVYQSRQDNSFTYTTHLMNKYRESCVVACEKYDPYAELHRSLPYLRTYFKGLIEKGYLVPVGRLEYCINPMLTYRAEYIRASEYSEMVKQYQGVHFNQDVRGLREMVTNFMKLINQRIKEKK